MASLPKFEDKLKRKLVDPASDQSAHPGYGIILNYDILHNTADVLMANKGSEEPGQVFRNVPCPVQLGVQSVAPEKGRPCLLVFKDNTYLYPMVTHYFNHVYNMIDYQRQTKAVNITPRFMFQT